MLTLAQVIAGLGFVALSVYLNLCCLVTVPPNMLYEKISVGSFMGKRKRRLLSTGRHFIFPGFFRIQTYTSGLPVQIPEDHSVCPSRSIKQRVVELKSGASLLVSADFRYALDPSNADVAKMEGSYDQWADAEFETQMNSASAGADTAAVFWTNFQRSIGPSTYANGFSFVIDRCTVYNVVATTVGR